MIRPWFNPVPERPVAIHRMLVYRSKPGQIVMRNLALRLRINHLLWKAREALEKSSLDKLVLTSEIRHLENPSRWLIKALDEGTGISVILTFDNAHRLINTQETKL